MQYSTNFNMNKPELSEQYGLSHWNDNTDIIDAEMQAIRSGTDDVMKATLLNFCYPIGSIYWSGVATNPHDLFGGTWQQIKDCFVWAKGDSDVLDATGGEKTHTLTTTEMPSHTHTFTGSAVTSGANNRGHTHSVTASGSISGGAYKFSGSAVTSGANSRGHTHTLNNGNTSSAGTTTTAGIRFVAVTSGGSSATNTGTESSHTHGVGTIATAGAGAWKMWQRGISGSNITDQIISADGIPAATKGTAISQVGGTAWYTGQGTTNRVEFNTNKNTAGYIGETTHTHTMSGNTGAGSSHSHTMAHTHSVTASGYIYGKTDGESQNHTHSVTAEGTVSVTTNPTFTGSAVTSGAESQNHTHSVTASGTNANSGGGGAHNNMPPYVVKYCWQRIA